ncbi:sensor histidine kinase [Burkholderia gladioli]|uniref:sensor histidine kinase n=1 Tax=Burkholderia gladioli TaxID=28095 RepID=UPI001641415C|nr:sensor histidine kinase [Burkholderia gladioli]
MTLADFIEADLPGLLHDWTEYARSLSDKDRHLSDTQLQNDGAALLHAIVADMRGFQSADFRENKSLGERDSGAQFNLLAERHANARVSQGFSIVDVAAEFRALRAAVLRRWERRCEVDPETLQEMIRFNEAIDQALSESIRGYSIQVEQGRDLFVGMVSHDLRSPLNAITTSLYLLTNDPALPARNRSVAAIAERATVKMKRLLDDLLTFTRTRLHDDLPLQRQVASLQDICTVATDEVRAAFPQAVIDLQFGDDLTGWWDPDRIAQMVVNLLANAARYGRGSITVQVQPAGDQISLSVFNEGDPIPDDRLPTLFEPLSRSDTPDRSGAAAGMGLGLYICRCISSAHGGTIDVTSSPAGPTFIVTLPRSSPTD